MSDLTSTASFISPWPMSVTVSTEPEAIVSVTGISGNSYVFNYDGAGIGLVSPTVANEDNAEAELPALFTAFKASNP